MSVAMDIDAGKFKKTEKLLFRMLAPKFLNTLKSGPGYFRDFV